MNMMVAADMSPLVAPLHTPPNLNAHPQTLPQFSTSWLLDRREEEALGKEIFSDI